ncbi:type IX secretion system periplasmic lipoprotein PorW/SprE [Spongiivirga citrea]|uniref:type IX secretion system periplasmic lipoprotein PorW/SprE n=1 Tax=Spongiivirga citrea TaxID=1481457 RepID=UPI00195332B7|nr:hypothetical protein [Spongiivirga citrea]
MNRISTYCLLTIVFVLGLNSCSTKKDKFLNRSFHSVNTKYNVLFNGTNALTEGRATLAAQYQENFWDLLPVERMEVKDEVKLESEDNNPNFVRAEEKAVKAIQKHNMNINGRQRNKQIDDAYMLLGKARYFDQRFVPALEAFNYILYKYPESDNFPIARVWREKTNMRLGYHELAIENLKLLFKSGNLSNQVYANGKAAQAEAYVNLQYKDSAVQALKLAANLTEINEEKGRYNFIVGQLYNELGHKDTANMAFGRVIDLNRKIPRNYLINAYLQKVRNVDLKEADLVELREFLTRMEESRENRPYLDKIYRQIAEFYLKTDSIEGGVDYLNKSIRKTNNDKILLAMNYEDLGTINFDDRAYIDAGAYYDSTLLNLVESTKKFRTIKRKRDNLQDVIKYETIVKESDSILTLVNMTEQEQEAYVNKYIEGLKADAEALKQAEERAARGEAGAALSNLTGSGQNASTQFYFYNTTITAYGKNEFRRIWGDRKLEDNWRLSSKASVGSNNDIENLAVAEEEVITDQEKYDPKFYLAKIPVDPKAIDSIFNGSNFANYQLGLIYKEKFREYELSAEKLEKVLANKPEDKLIIPTKYYLIKVYELLNSPLAEQYKNDILSNHPNSRYAAIIRNPQQMVSSDGNSPEQLYSQLYRNYEAQNYEEVILKSKKYIDLFNGDEIVPKFEMLKATADGKLNGFETYKKGLNFVALNYPNKSEGKEAQNIIDNTLPRFEKNKNFKSEEGGRSFKLVYNYQKLDTAAFNPAVDSIKAVMKRKDLRFLKVSKDVYDPTKLFVVVHGFSTANAAKGFADIMLKNKNYKIDHENFVILTENYEILQIHKNLETYLRNQKTDNP